MQGPRPNKLHDDLDALLDGRPVELTDELAPLVETADVLRIELAGYQLDPEVADRHLERVLGDPGKVVQLPVRRPAGGWDVRRRIVAVALAAALVLAPATMASAAALPGQAMYPFKLAIEQVRIASVQWSPALEAGERTRVADERLEEVQTLFRLERFGQLPGALKALERAVIAAKAAVAEASREGELPGKVVAKLTDVEVVGRHVVETVRVAAARGLIPVSGGTLKAVEAAAEESQDVLPPPMTTPVPPAVGIPPPTTQSTSGSASSQTTESAAPPTSATSPPTSASQPPPTTAPPTTTTNPPPTDPTASSQPAPQDPPAADQARDAAGLGGMSSKTPFGVGGIPPTSTP